MSGEENNREDRFLSAKELCERYGMSKTWPYNQPEIRAMAYRFGKYFRWKLSDLEAYEQANKKISGDLVWMKERAIFLKKKKLKFDLA